MNYNTQYNNDQVFEEWLYSISDDANCGTTGQCPVGVYFNAHDVPVSSVLNTSALVRDIFEGESWMHLSPILSQIPNMVDEYVSHLPNEQGGARWYHITPIILRQLWEKAKWNTQTQSTPV